MLRAGENAVIWETLVQFFQELPCNTIPKERKKGKNIIFQVLYQFQILNFFF